MKRNREIDKLRLKPAVGDDLFVRYLLGKIGNEKMLEDMVNAALSDFNFEEVKDLEIIDPYNLSENIDLKESIIDIKAKTKDNQTVIIEIQLCGNMDFVKRIFYYISKNIVNELKEGEDYKKLPRIISINLLNFNLDFGDEGKPHRCFKLIDTKNHGTDLDFIQMHIIEAKRFIEIIEKKLMGANPIMTKVIEEYKRFTSDDKLMRAYDARDAFLLGQKMMLSREREEGFEEGMEKGIEEGRLEGERDKSILIAKNLKKAGLDIKFISENTGLTIKEIEKL